MAKVQAKPEGSETSVAAFRQMIVERKIGAITVDTTTFDDGGKQFDKGIFSQLKQFGKHPQQLILSEIVLSEITSHYQERLEKTRARFDRDMHDACAFVGGPPQLVEAVAGHLAAMPDVGSLCAQQIGAFLTDANAEVLSADDFVKVSDVVSLYFSKRPPFHEENPKKKEFPDAIALTTLERWAAQNDTGVVVVSRDGDWEAFCRNSSRLYLVKTLAQALSIFQTPDEIVETMVARLRSELSDESTSTFELIRSTIEEYDWSDNVNMESYSSFELDEEADFEIQEVTFHDTGGDAVKITENDGKFVSFSVDFKASGNAALHCSFAKWDGVDREYINLGHDTFEQSFDTTVSVSLTMPLVQGSFDDITIDIQPEHVHLDFGEVEPDWVGRASD
jgi:hypothetical protein